MQLKLIDVAMEHQRLLMGLGLKRYRNHQTAEDAVQSFIVHCLTSTKLLDPSQYPRAFVVKSFYNFCLNWGRRKRIKTVQVPPLYAGPGHNDAYLLMDLESEFQNKLNATVSAERLNALKLLLLGYEAKEATREFKLPVNKTTRLFKVLKADLDKFTK